MKAQVTIRDIAEHTGLGIATVSRALNDRPKVSPQSRERVLAAAEALGYQADPAMRVFVKRRWPEPNPSRLNIGVLCLGDDAAGGETQQFIQALQTHAEATGYQLIVFDLAAFRDVDALQRRLLAQGVSGLFVPPMERPPYDLAPLWSRLPAVLCCPADYSPALPTIACDDFRRARAAWDYAVGKGYQRIGIVVPDYPRSESMDARMSGLLLGWAWHRPQIPFLKYKEQLSAEMLQTWVGEHRPEIVIGFDVSVWKVLQSLDKPLPDFAALYLWKVDEVGRFPGSLYGRGRICAQAWERLEFMISHRIEGVQMSDLKELINLPYTVGAGDG